MRSIFSFLFLSLLISGCSLFGSDNEPAEIQFTLQNFSTDEVSITTTGTKPGLNISKNDFSDNGADHIPGSTKSFITDNSGMMTVMFSFLNENSELSEGEFEIELREDWLWSVNFQINSADYNPLDGCFGCLFYESFKLNPETLNSTEVETDSLYVIAGGNYISEPVIY